MESRQNHRSLINILIPLLVLLPAAWALLPAGLPNTADGPVHFIRAAEMVHAWQEGVFIPRWSANLGYGYGIPLFIYAPPLPYFLAAFFHALGLSLEVGMKGMLLTGLAVCSFGAYYLGRDTLGPLPGAVCAVAGVYAPMRMRELFIQGNAGQFMAWSFLPGACWGVIRLYQTGQKRYVLVIGLAFMGASLSHNVVGLLLAPMLALLTLTLLWGTKDIQRTLWVIMGGALGLGLGAWFWLPALVEGKYLQLFHIVASDFRRRFVPLAELVALSPPLDRGAINPFFPLTLGAVQIGLAILGLVGVLGGFVIKIIPIFYRGQPKRPLSSIDSLDNLDSLDSLTLFIGLFFAGFTLFGAFMALEWSEPIWSILPFVNLFEFPARWHGFTAVGLAWLCGLAVHLSGGLNLKQPKEQLERLVGIGALLLLFGSALVNLYPHHLPLGSFKSEPVDVVRFEIETGAVGTTSLGEFNPIWITDHFGPTKLADDYLAGRPIKRLNPELLPPNATSQVELTASQAHQFKLNLPTETSLTLDLLYFPGWQATVDGTPITISPHPGSGLIDLTMPAGDHRLTLTFRETPLRRLADTISIFTWAGLIGLISFHFVQQKRVKRDLTATSSDSTPRNAGPLKPNLPPGETNGVSAGSSSDSASPGRPAKKLSTLSKTGKSRLVSSYELFLIGVTVALTLGVREIVPAWFQLASPPGEALPATTPLTANFADQVRLLGADLPAKIMKQGDTLTVVAYWQALQDLDTNYAVFLHLDTPNGETIATVDEFHPTEIPTSHWPPTLYHRNPLQLTMPATAPPIRYDLRLGLYDNQTGEPLSLVQTSDGQTTFMVGQVWAAADAPPQSLSGPQAQFGPSISLQGVHYDEDKQTVSMYWQTETLLKHDYSIFLHLLDADGQLVGQVDGLPYQNQYPTTAWRVGQVIADERPLTGAVVDVSQIAQINQLAIGVYNPATAERLEATDQVGQPLLNSALLIKLEREIGSQ